MTIELKPNGLRVLIADDHGISRNFVADALGHASIAVKLAKTGQDALVTALAWHPMVICIDIHLPDANGLEIIRQIRSAWPPDRAQPRIIILTGDDSGLFEKDLLALDVAAVLLKPVPTRELREAVLLRRQGQVSEPSGVTHSLELKNLFHQELEQRLPELERFILDLDYSAAASTLHQLIASSAITGEHRLESALRVLNTSVGDQVSSRQLARDYYAVLECSRKFVTRLAG